jgi:WD40 repeat protein
MGCESSNAADGSEEGSRKILNKRTGEGNG